MPTPEIGIKINADASPFEKELNKLLQDVKGLSGQIQGAFSSILKPLSFVGLGTSLGAIFSSIKDKTTEAQRSVNQLNAVLRLTGESAGLTAKQIGDIGEEIKGKSVFGSGDIRDAATALLRFRSIQGDVFKDILKLAPDAATVLGVTLPEAAEKLGRAFTDPERGLRSFKQVGFEISEQQVDLAARLRESGDVAGSQRIVFEALRKTMAGAGEADTQGLLGASSRLDRAISDLQKTLGKKFLSESGGATDLLASGFKAITKEIDGADLSLLNLLRHLPSLAPLKLLADVRSETGIGKSRGISGKINFDAFNEAEAQRNAAAKQEEIQSEKDYEREKILVKNRAHNAASEYASQLATQENFLAMQSSQYEVAYKRDELASADFYEAERKRAKDLATLRENNINKQIERADEAAKHPGTSLEERAGFNQHILSLTNQAVNVRLGLEKEILKINQDQEETIRQQKRSYEDLNLELLQLTGTSSEVATATFDRSHRDELLKIRAAQTSNNPDERDAALQAEKTINQSKERVLQQVKLNDTEAAYARILAKVNDEQARIDLAQQSGEITTLDAINKKSAAATKYIASLTKEVDALQAIVDTTKEGAAGRDDLITKIAGLRLEIDQLAASANQLENTFRDIFVTGVADGLTELVTGTKSVKEAFKDMEKSIVASISRIASQNIAESLFGKSGVGGGVAGIFAKLFGGGGGGGIGYGATSGDIFPVGLPYAGGTDFASPGLHLVGEHGPEYVRMRGGEQVTPNNAMGRGRGLTVVNNNNFYVAGDLSRSTQDQMALKVAMRTQRAASRIG